MLDLIRTAMSSEDVLLEGPHNEEQILAPSPRSRARTARSEEGLMEEHRDTRKYETGIRVIDNSV